MSVEIKELIIRAVVTESSSNGSLDANQSEDEKAERTRLIQECVREVLKRLDKIKER